VELIEITDTDTYGHFAQGVVQTQDGRNFLVDILALIGDEEPELLDDDNLNENDDDLFATSNRVQRDIEDYNHPLKDVGRCDKTDYDMLINEIDYTINKLGQNPNEDELSAVVDQLEYSLDPMLVKFLDSVLAGAIAVGSDRFNRSLVQALRDGEQRYGTEPRPAVHAAVDALVRGWKDVSRMQDRRSEQILGQNR
jgi:hypothetical protein